MRVIVYLSLALSVVSISIMPIDSYAVRSVAINMLIYGMLGFLSVIFPAAYFYLNHIFFRRDESIAYVGKTVLLSVIFLVLLTIISSPLIKQFSTQYSTRFTKVAQLGRLYWDIMDYATEHNGQLPSATAWCELLSKDGDQLYDAVRLGPSGAYICQIAFNSNLSEFNLYGIPTNAVLLFTASGDWNLSGGYELMRSQNQGYAYICLVDGRIMQYRLKDSKIIDLKHLHTRPLIFDSTKEKSMAITWKP